MKTPHPQEEEQSHYSNPLHSLDDLNQNSGELEGIVSKEAEKEYSPSLSRIAYEMSKRAAKATVEQLNPAKETVGAFVYGFAYVNLLPYAIPTAARQILSSRVVFGDIKSKILNSFFASGCGFGFISGVLGQIVVYSIVAGRNDESAHPEILLLPVATNTLSLLYESARCVYKKGQSIKNELIAEHKEKKKQ